MRLKFCRLFIILSLLISWPCFALDDMHESSISMADRQLNIDKESYDLVRKQFQDLKIAKDRQFQSLQDKGVSTNTLKHAQVDAVAAQAAVEGSNIALVDAKQVFEEINTSIHSLEKDLQSLVLLSKESVDRADRIISVETKLEFLKRLQLIENDRIATLNEIRSLTLERLALEKNWQQKIRLLYSAQQQDVQRNRLAEVQSSLQTAQQDWLTRLSNLTQQLKVLTRQGQVNDSTIKKLHLEILAAEENVALVRLKSYLVHIQTRVENFEDINRAQITTAALNDLVDQTTNIISQLNATEEFVKAKNQILNLKKNELSFEVNKQILSPQDVYAYSHMLNNLMVQYENERDYIHKLQQKSAYYQHQFKLALQHHLSERQKFPRDLSGWVSLGQKMLEIPYLLINAFSNFVSQTIIELKNINTWAFNFSLLIFTALIGSWFYFRGMLLNIEINIKKDKQRFSTNVVYILLELIRRNLGSMLIFAVVLAVSLLLNMASMLFVYISMVYLCFKIILSASKLILIENITDHSGNDVKLYHRIRSSLLLGFCLSSLAVVAHHMPVAYDARIFVNRLFMFFILILAWQLFKVRSHIPSVLESLVHIPRKYFYRVLQLLCFLIPFALFFNAILGLLGYVELAWAVAKYQAIFILVLAGYLIVRGLLIDAMEYLSELLIRYVNRGWLWTEALLKPFDRILRIILFFLSVIFLLRCFNLDTNEFFLRSADTLLHKKLFTIGGNSIDALLLCKILVIISLIKWLSRWSREFSYRWVYAKAKDIGVRNSLAIFTQYTSVIVSVLIGLQILGIDLRGFTVVAAAFAAGIGFGMRDLIVNFFSGILLLIERPFRTGDIITLGNHEGEVIQTGMRSMTLRTWDHMEVIVPNADMFTKSFVNWTHHDNIVRTVITLKIHRDDDPHRVQKMLLDLLGRLNSVAKDPIPEVIMHELSDSLIEMQVRYYILLTTYRTRAGVRSEVLFAIWDCFKTNNIRSPNPQYDLILKNKQHETFDVSAFEMNS